MGRQRRRQKLLTIKRTTSEDSDVVDVCENCRLVQKDGKKYQPGRRHSKHHNKLADSLSFLSSTLDCESETDSAIDTASISSSSDNSSIASDSAIEFGSVDESCRVIAVPRKGKVAEVSIADIEKAEAETDLAALAEFVTGVPFQKFTSKDSCVECIESYQRALHVHQHNQLQMYGIDDSFSVDLTGLDMQVHIEEFTNWSYGNTVVQTKEHGYYVSPQGATYYTDMPVDGKLLSLPRQLMIPPSERAMFDATHPPQRPWMPLAHPERNRPTALFTVMNYNILSDSYCTRQMYGYCPSWALHWDYRRRGILEEIRHYSADILCLQEVEKEQFNDFFKVEFEKDGYEGIFAPKSRFQTMSEDQSKKVDGCAIFWRVHKFKLVDQHKVEYSRLAINNAESFDPMINRVHPRDNIGLFALLETKEGAWDTNGLPSVDCVRRPVVVATTHCTWDPDYCDVKLIQSIMLMSELKQFVEKSNTLLAPNSPRYDCTTMPMIVAGDFNSQPNSGVLEFLTNSKISTSHADFKEYDYEQVLKVFSHAKLANSLTHPFNMKSAYDQATMEFTNFTYEFKDIIDYVFYTGQMNPLGVLGSMDKEWFKSNKVVGCPHPHVPSDHFSLLVEFELPATESQGTDRR